MKNAIAKNELFTNVSTFEQAFRKLQELFGEDVAFEVVVNRDAVNNPYGLVHMKGKASSYDFFNVEGMNIGTYFVYGQWLMIHKGPDGNGREWGFKDCEILQVIIGDSYDIHKEPVVEQRFAYGYN